MLTAESCNLRAWNGRPGHYEVWYTTLNHGDRGYWIRTTLRAPVQGPPEGALWFVEFVPGRAPRAWKDPIAPPEGPHFRGRAGEAEWDIKIESAGPVFRPIPATLRGFVGTKIATPHLDARISGTIRVGGEEVRLDGARGTQSHLWGKGYGNGWAWAHASFEGGTFEGLAGKKPALTALYARHGRMQWKLNTLLAAVRNRSTRAPSPDGWRFSGTTYNREIAGEIRVDPKHVAGVTYTGPAGEKIYCYNSEIATIAIELRARTFFGAPWRTVATVRGPAHFEVAGREPVAGIPLLLT